jgi:fermentation-respiration switch protein FrsA (DUF1100 family)
VLEVVFLVVFWTWAAAAVLFVYNTILPRASLDLAPGALNLPVEPVRFPATDGMRLEGWLIRGDPAGAWIICCHGAGTNRTDLVPVAAQLYAAGFNLLLFDFRGHGASQGWVTSFGWREQRDLEGALAFLGRQLDVPARPYGIYGVSMGAAVALMVAARDERIAAVAVDSPYTRLDEALRHHLKLYYPLLPTRPFLWYILATYRLRFGVWPRRLSPIDSAAALSPRPLLIIQGTNDPRVPLAGTQRMFARAGGPKELWIVEGAEHDHVASFSRDPEGYRVRVVRFFSTFLG